jgi:VWFA-related protein
MTPGRRAIARAVLASCLLAGNGLAAPAQEPRAVFSSRIEVVRIDALVTRERKVVEGLTAEDFQVTDNGVPQQVELLGFEEQPLTVVIALDESASLTGDRLAQLRTAGASLAAILKKDDRAALLTFSETIALPAPPSANLGVVRSAIAAARVQDGARPTALADAVFAAVLAAESVSGRALVVVLSDGVDTGSWLRKDAVVEIARRADPVIYAVATFHGGRDDFLRDLTNATGGSCVELDQGGDIGAALLAVLNEFRERYVIAYTPRGVARDGWHAVRVRVKNRDADVTARPGYWGAK